MKRITKIKENNLPVMKKKLRVAAYARVSTSSEEQLLSLETQKAHYENYINANDEWEFAGLYYDEGISGTKMEKRAGLLRLLDDCEEGRIDYIITKSISRFSRNTADCLQMIRRLLELNVPVFFEKENIHTGSMESELMLTILSSMAESESASISKNEKWSIQKRFQDGSYIISYPPYGYANVEGEMVIIPEQAVIVKRIFQEALAGKGSYTIARGLNADGVEARKGGKWTAGTINGILSNEKYTGDAVFQKTYTDANYNRHKNRGEQNQYLVEEHHEAIVSHEDFDRVQNILVHNGKEKRIEKGTGKYQQRYTFSSKIKCGECGSVFKRRQHYKPSGNYIAWCCNRHLDHKHECSMKYVTDESIKRAFVTMMRKLSMTHKQLLQPFVSALDMVDDKERFLQLSVLDEQMEKNMEQRQVLVNLMAGGILEPAVFNRENNELLAEMNQLQEEREKLAGSLKVYKKQAIEAQKLLKFVMKQKPMTQFQDEVFREYVDEITVLSREEIVFSLRCGLELKERLVNE